MIAWQAVLVGIGPHRAILELHDARQSPKPQVAIRVLENTHDGPALRVIAGGIGPVGHSGAILVSGQSIAPAEPHVAVPVLNYRVHHEHWQARRPVELRRAALLEPDHSLECSDPQVSVAVFGNRCYEI